MRDRGRQSGGASNQWPACFCGGVRACVCVCAHGGMFVCITAGMCVAQCEALCRASRLKLCKQVTMSKLNPHTLTHKHTHTSSAQGQAQRQGSRGVLAVGGSEKQIMINWLAFYKTLPLMHLG